MLYFLSSSIMLSVSSFTNFYVMGVSVLSYSLSWLLCGGIFISSVSYASKKKAVWMMMMSIILFSFLTNSLFMFYMTFEMSLIPIVLMILMVGNQPERLSAVVYFLMYTSAVSIPFLALVVFLLKTSFLGSSLIIVSDLFCLVLLSPFLVKMPVLGVHFWLPKAHVEANTSGSMILAGILLKLGSYGVFRVSYMMKMKFSLLSFFWLFSSIMSSMLTFMQSDVKKLVAYSSVTHMTFFMVGLSLSNKFIVVISLLISLSHGWGSMVMFSYAGTVSSSSNSRLSFYLNAEYKMTWFILLFGLILMMNASMPPFPSFFSEVLTLSSYSSFCSGVMLFIFVSLVICYYNAFLFLLFFHGKPLFTSLPCIFYMEGQKNKFLFFSGVISLIFLSLG